MKKKIDSCAELVDKLLDCEQKMYDREKKYYRVLSRLFDVEEENRRLKKKLEKSEVNKRKISFRTRGNKKVTFLIREEDGRERKVDFLLKKYKSKYSK